MGFSSCSEINERIKMWYIVSDLNSFYSLRKEFI